MLKTYLKHVHRQKLRNRKEKGLKTSITEKRSEAAIMNQSEKPKVKNPDPEIKREKKKEKGKRILF